MFSRIVTGGDNDRMVGVGWGDIGSRKSHEEVTVLVDDSLTWGSGRGGKAEKKDLKGKLQAKIENSDFMHQPQKTAFICISFLIYNNPSVKNQL